MKNIIDLDLIEKLLKSSYTSYKIAKDTRMTIPPLERYRSGESKIENMAVKSAKKLSDYAIKEGFGNMKKITFQEIISGLYEAEAIEGQENQSYFNYSEVDGYNIKILVDVPEEMPVSEIEFKDDELTLEALKNQNVEWIEKEEKLTDDPEAQGWSYDRKDEDGLYIQADVDFEVKDGYIEVEA